MIARALTDFPDRMPAMMVKEFRQGLRATMFILPFMVVHLLALVAMAVEYIQSIDSAAFNWLPRTFPFWIVAYSVVSLVMPLRSLTTLQDEGEGNGGLLMLGGLTRWQIVRGKWFVQIFLCSVTLVSLLPYMLVRYFFGGFDLIANSYYFLNVAAAAAAFSGCVICASGYSAPAMRWVVLAMVGTYILLAGMAGHGIASTLSFATKASQQLGIIYADRKSVV